MCSIQQYKLSWPFQHQGIHITTVAQEYASPVSPPLLRLLLPWSHLPPPHSNSMIKTPTSQTLNGSAPFIPPHIPRCRPGIIPPSLQKSPLRNGKTTENSPYRPATSCAGIVGLRPVRESRRGWVKIQKKKSRSLATTGRTQLPMARGVYLKDVTRVERRTTGCPLNRGALLDGNVASILRGPKGHWSSRITQHALWWERVGERQSVV